jgi:hypothetical protein
LTQLETNLEELRAMSPRETPASDSREAMIFGVYDRLTDHENCLANVVLVPADESGAPDWDRADPTNLESLPADEWPEDERAAMRAAVIVDHIDGCSGDTSMLVFLRENDEPSMIQIAGPEADRDIAHAIIARDIGAAPVVRPPSKFAESLEKLGQELFAPKAPPVAANDNKPAKAEKPSAFVDAETLLGMEFSPIKYVIPGYVAEGLTLLGGRPKLGKSWLALDFGIAVASGGLSLGVECEQGDAFYLALEDNQRRLQDRLRVVLPKFHRPDMSRLSLLTEAPKINAGLIETLEAWRTRVSNPRLIIVDTLAMVRAEKKRNQDSYSADYEALSPLQRYASAHRLAIIVVTHVRKAEAEDPLEMISGTNGLTGAADSIMILNRTADGPKLYGRGRDVEEVEKALKFDGGKWSVLGNVDDVKRSDQRQKILTALSEAEKPIGPSEIATAAGMTAANVRYLLGKMVKAGECEKSEFGLYVLPSHPSHPSQSNVIFPPSQCNNTECEGCEDCEGGTPHSASDG